MASVTARKNPSGTVHWRVQARDHGRMMQETFYDEKAARSYAALVDRVGFTAARAMRIAANSGHDGVMTLRDWAHTYLDTATGHLAGVTEATAEGYRLLAERSFLPILGQLPLDAITAQEVNKWLRWQERQPNQRTGQPVSAKTVKNYHGVLSSMLSAAVKAGHLEGNKARGVRLTRGRPHEMTLLSPAEFERVWVELPDYCQPLARFLAGTGARWGEACALTWADINTDVAPATARITKAFERGPKGSPQLGPTKTSKSVRTVSLPVAVTAAMGARGAPAGLVFPGPHGVGQQAWSKRFHRDWNTAVAASGIGKQPRVHDLRHAQASWLIAAGVPLPMIQARLGHEKVTTTVDTYGHLAPEAHVQMALVMDGLMPAPPIAETGRSAIGTLVNRPSS